MKKCVLKSSNGLTLIELLIVVAILGAVSMMTLSMVDNLDGKDRYHKTMDRLTTIRSSILGPDVAHVNGHLLFGGFIQDIGWPPVESRALVDSLHPYWSSFSRVYDDTWRTWYGWAGPYMNAQPRRKKDISDDTSVVYDDWGNEFYGWSYQGNIVWPQTPLVGPIVDPLENISIRSYGADGPPGGGADAFDEDIPHISQPLIPFEDWAVDIKDWQIEVFNDTNVELDFLTDPFRFMVVIPYWKTLPDDGLDDVVLDFWPSTDVERDQWGHIGGKKSAGLIPVGSSSTFRFGDDGNLPHRVPFGRRMIFMVDDNGTELVATKYRYAPIDGDFDDAFAEVLITRHLSPGTVKIRVQTK